MSPAVRWFLRTAALWLGVGLLLGIWMGVEPSRIPILRAPHLHSLLAGFVAFMIFGVGYHVLPRFAGRSVPFSAGPLLHLILANLGLLGLVAGLLARLAHPFAGRILMGTGGVLTLAGALIFIHAAWTLTERPQWPSSIPKPPP